MRLYRLGDSGEPVRDIQDRLSALGFTTSPDPEGEYGEPTRAAVTGFQKNRGLQPDGIVGPDTWRALYEAGYRLGDRLLYLRRPMIRGDDVAELQSRLNALGFDAGKVDGIYGPDSQSAVLEFQHNRRVAEDGRAGPEVITEIALVTRTAGRAGREAVREREWMRMLPRSMIGARVFFDPACRNAEESAATWKAASEGALLFQQAGGVPVLSRSAGTTLPERVRARRANRFGSDLIVSWQVADPDEDQAIFFYQSPRSKSEAGENLAARISEELDLPTEGRATAILMETRAPAVIICAHELGSGTAQGVINGLDAFFRTRGQEERER